MAIIVNLDVMMAKRKMSVTELANRVDITMANLSILKNKAEEEAAAPAGPTQEELLAEIRDLLKAKK